MEGDIPSLPSVLKSLLNKETVPERKVRDRKGYGNARAARMLVCRQARNIRTDKGLARRAGSNASDMEWLSPERCCTGPP